MLRCNLLAEECSWTLALVQHDTESGLECITFYNKCPLLNAGNCKTNVMVKA
jgi:hypothetical protein